MANVRFSNLTYAKKSFRSLGLVFKILRGYGNNTKLLQSERFTGGSFTPDSNGHVVAVAAAKGWVQVSGGLCHLGERQKDQ